MLIGLRQEPGKWHGEEISHGYLGKGERTLVTFGLGDTVGTRSPNHYEARRLKTLAREPIVEVQRSDAVREVFRASLITLKPEDLKLLVLEPEMSDAVVKANASVGLIFGGKAETPDLTKPQWRQIYEDIRTDIENDRLEAGDRVPPLPHLAKMYGFSQTTTLKALHILQAEGWIEARGRIGRFVCPRPRSRRIAMRDS
jgi:hypothetical protein